MLGDQPGRNGVVGRPNTLGMTQKRKNQSFTFICFQSFLKTRQKEQN
jgi:hypothetical protein